MGVPILLGLILIIQPGCPLAAEESSDDDSQDYGRGIRHNSPEETAAFMLRQAENKHLVPKQNLTAHIEVFYLEHVLASWILEHSPWNAYHSGIGFRVYETSMENANRIGEYAIDFSPRLTDQIKYILHPIITPVYPDWMPTALGKVYAWAAASYDIVWENEGYVRWSNNWHSKYENSTFVGNITGSMFNDYLDWVYTFEEEHTTFEPVEMIVNTTIPPDSKEERIRGSSMCHDLFYYSLDKLKNLGFEPKPKRFIFRDHIVVYADSYEKADMSDWRTRRRVIRYFTLFADFMKHINEEFTHIRNLLVGADILHVSPYLYKNGEYYLVNMVPPFVNYCYLPVYMPPARASIWQDEKFCALESTLSSNRTAALNLMSWQQIFYVGDTLIEEPLAWLCVLSAVCILPTLWRAFLSVAVRRGEKQKNEKPSKKKML